MGAHYEAILFVRDMIAWFLAHYEAPVHHCPYISAEGGYQWIFGGPYDAREVLQAQFPEATDWEIDAAVEEVESEGTTEWSGEAYPHGWFDEDLERTDAGGPPPIDDGVL
jgi:hypothetical protein